jgi:hypothetical protein
VEQDREAVHACVSLVFQKCVSEVCAEAGQAVARELLSVRLGAARLLEGIIVNASTVQRYSMLYRCDVLL